jgi:type IV pilus assembly protein PilA
MRRSGLTIIEVLMVVVIVVLLIAIAYPRFAGNRQRQYVYDARTSLEQLRDAQDAYYAQHRQYAGDLTTAKFTPPPDVVMTIGGAGVSTGTGWWATATSSKMPSIRCYIGVGVDTVFDNQHLRPAAVTCP